MTNWVHERATKEIEIQSRAAEFFDNLFVACEDALSSFNRFYPHSHARTRIDRLGPGRFVVRIGSRDSFSLPPAVGARQETVVHFALDPELCVVKVGVQKPDQELAERTYPLSIRQGEMVVCSESGEHSAAEFSRLILERLLFPSGPAILARQETDS